MSDQHQEAQRRCGIVEDVRLDLVLDLQKMLHETNNIVRSFKTALEQAPSEKMRVVIHAHSVTNLEAICTQTDSSP